jgi:hypothetical protein
MQGLKQALASQSAPPNPQTPKDRTDPAETTLLSLQRVRRSLDRLKEELDEADPRTLLVGAMGSCVTRLLSHIELTDAVDVLLERAFPLSSPQLKQRLQAMFAPPPPPISPPTGLGGGMQGPGIPPGPNQGPAGGATGQPPGGPPPGGPMPGDAGVATLPA